MKKYLNLLLIILFIACSSRENDAIEDQTIPDTSIVKQEENPLESLHPENLSKDLSWIVSLDIQEGFLLSYTITYQNGDEITKKVKDLDVGGVDYPEPYFINDTTYFVPNMGGTKNGHYEMYIHYNGEAEYKEIIH